VEHLAEILLRDRAFFRHSGGGVTLSGGECTLYPEYLEPLLHLLKKEGVHVALETSGYFDYPVFRRKLLPHFDLIYFDFKIGDPQLHRRYCGKSNRRIYRNLKALIREGAAVVYPRIPLVPNITATAENLAAIVDLLCLASASDVTLLPYNPLGVEMAINLGRAKPPLLERFMTAGEEGMIREMFLKILGDKKNEYQN
jgi:pyruvate formate lyase activating enzyme